MAEVVLTNAFLSVDGTDLSDHVRQITLRINNEPQDITAMSDTFRNRIAGLKDWSADVEWNQDYAASEVDVTLQAIVLGDGLASLVIRPDAGVIAVTNPEYTGDAIIQDYQAVGGAVGDVHVSPTSFLGAGTLARATA